jgi:integrase
MLYRRGDVWWYKFRFAGRVFRESAKTTSKMLARQAERKRHQGLEEGVNGIKKRVAPITLAAAATEWLKLKKPSLAASSYRIEETHIEKRLKPAFGAMLVIDLTADDIAEYQRERLRKGASPKTINLEIGTLRAILRRHRIWANLQPDVRMLSVRDDAGKALTSEEERALLEACGASRSRALLPAVTLALNTGMRRGEILDLTWGQIDFLDERLIVGKSKTEAGHGRTVPLNATALAALKSWATKFPDRKPNHFVFPAERYGVAGNDRTPHAHSGDPTKALNSLKEAWESAKTKSGVRCRFHDLRHSACTRLVERGVPLPVIASLLGWSAGTTVRMARRYGHITAEAQRKAVQKLMLDAHGAEGQERFPTAGASPGRRHS